MGRSPCCEKVGLKKGPWTPEEDQKLLAYVEEHGHGSWRALPANAGLERCGKSCRLRWTNYLRPDIKRGKFSMQEEQTIIQLHALLGNRWSAIATHLPKRTDNEIKNYWNTHLKKRLANMGIDPITHKPKSNTTSPTDTQSNANLSHMAQWETARLEAEARLVRESKLRATSSSASTNSSSSTPLDPTCVDAFHSWQGVWPSTAFMNGPASQGGTRTDLDSPTSTIGVAENALPSVVNLAADTQELLDWKSLNGKCVNVVSAENRMDNYTGIDASWTVSESASLRPDGTRYGAAGFTGMLLDDATGGHERNGKDDEEDEQSCVECGDGQGNGEGNKSYWNNILNFVNSSSPSLFLA